MSDDPSAKRETSRFDRFVEAAHARVSRAPSVAVVTLLLVALLENAGRRDSNAAQAKLDTIAGALADLIDSRAADDPELRERAADLRRAVGLEERAGT